MSAKRPSRWLEELTKGDEQKLRYATERTRDVPPVMAEGKQLAVGVQEAIAWEARWSASEAVEKRRKMLGALRAANECLRRAGDTQAWFRQADKRVRGVAAGVNGPLFEQLLKETRYCKHEVA